MTYDAVFNFFLKSCMNIAAGYVLTNTIRTQIAGALTFGAMGYVYGYSNPKEIKSDPRSIDNTKAELMVKATLKLGGGLLKNATVFGWAACTFLDAIGASKPIADGVSKCDNYFGVTNKASELLHYCGWLQTDAEPKPDQEDICIASANIKAQTGVGCGVLAAVVFHTVTQLDILTFGSSALGALYFLYNADSKGELRCKVENSEEIIWDVALKQMGYGAFIGTAVYLGATR